MSSRRSETTRVILAYSGSLESSIAISWLAERHAAEVIAVTIDLGQGRELEEVRDRALATGAVRAHVLDSRDEFAKAFIVRALRADATTPDGAPIGRALARPLVARELVQIAAIEQAATIAHAGVGTAVDTTARALNPALRVLAPAREWNMSPAQQLAYARERQLPLPPDSEAHVGLEPPPEPAAVEIAFDRGVPTGINSVSMPMLDLFDSLGTIAVAHGVGRGRGRDLRDAPASNVLHVAHRALRAVAASEDVNRLCGIVGREYAALVQRGVWFAAAREALDAFASAANEPVTGVVRLKMFHGECEILDVREGSPVQKLVPLTSKM